MTSFKLKFTTTVDDCLSSLLQISQAFAVTCICGNTMTLKQPRKEYHTTSNWCDSCERRNLGSEFTFHCPVRRNKFHTSGYDFCIACAKQKFVQSLNSNDNESLSKNTIKNNDNNNHNDADAHSNELQFILQFRNNSNNSDQQQQQQPNSKSVQAFNPILREMSRLKVDEIQALRFFQRIIAAKKNKHSNDRDSNDNHNDNIVNHAFPLEWNESQLKSNVEILKQLSVMESDYNAIVTDVMDMHVSQLSQILAEKQRRQSASASAFKEWHTEQALQWLFSLKNGKYKTRYQTELSTHMTQENVRGSALQYVDNACLLRWQIFDMQIRNEILADIAHLLNNSNVETATAATQGENEPGAGAGAVSDGEGR